MLVKSYYQIVFIYYNSVGIVGSADCRGRCLVGPVNSAIALNFLSLYNNNLNFI